jgi:hypothetical protein
VRNGGVLEITEANDFLLRSWSLGELVITSRTYAPTRLVRIVPPQLYNRLTRVAVKLATMRSTLFFFGGRFEDATLRSDDDVESVVTLPALRKLTIFFPSPDAPGDRLLEGTCQHEKCLFVMAFGTTYIRNVPEVEFRGFIREETRTQLQHNKQREANLPVEWWMIGHRPWFEPAFPSEMTL